MSSGTAQSRIAARPFGQRYAFVVVSVIFLCLLIAAGLRSAPAVMMLPLEEAFGWRRDVISFAAAVGIFLYGLTGPFAAALMERIGLRRTLLGALALMSASTRSEERRVGKECRCGSWPYEWTARTGRRSS